MLFWFLTVCEEEAPAKPTSIIPEVVGMAAAAIAGTAFVTGMSSYSVAPPQPPPVPKPPVVIWFRSFFAACAWAAMIAAGSLVFSYFTKRWQSAGLPVLPITMPNPQYPQQPPPPNNIFYGGQPQPPAAGLPTGAPTFQKAAPKTSSFLDEYEV